ncbi:hypothetical protein [Mesorhizobium sp. M0621]
MDHIISYAAHTKVSTIGGGAFGALAIQAGRLAAAGFFCKPFDAAP